MDMVIPYADGDVCSFLYDNATILSREYTESGVSLSVLLNREYAGRVRKYAGF
jgi:hypothetical protein